MGFPVVERWSVGRYIRIPRCTTIFSNGVWRGLGACKSGVHFSRVRHASGPGPSIQCASEATLFSDVSGFSGRSPTTFIHPAKSLYRRRLRSTMALTMTSATCLSSRQQAPTTSPPWGESARRADEGDILCDIKIFADRRLPYKCLGYTPHRLPALLPTGEKPKHLGSALNRHRENV